MRSVMMNTMRKTTRSLRRRKNKGQGREGTEGCHEDEEEEGDKVRRFFMIACSLPMDLQMVLCNRAFERPHSTISVADVNEAIFSVRSVFTDSRGRTGNERGACLLM